MSKLKENIKKILPKSMIKFYGNMRTKYWNNKFKNFEKEPFIIRTREELGVNLIGYIKGEFGLGESVRLLAKELEESGIPFTIYNYDDVASIRQGDTSWDHKITNTTPYAINLFHLNPIEMGQAYKKFGRELWDSKYNIAFWMWELTNLPEEWLPMLSLVDEIWTASDYSAISIKKATEKPVTVIPYAIYPNSDTEKYDRDFFSLPKDKFLYLCMYDSNSTMDRKNPEGAIKAYLGAFENENDNVGLVIKINNPKDSDIEILKNMTSGYKNIFFITETLEKTAVNSLIDICDVYISLHRSEGFGLVLAEAMYLGTPVVSTNYSSVTEFMNENVGAMVDYEIVDIQNEYGIYKKGNSWAEPDISDASTKIRKLYDDKQYYDSIKNNAYKYVRDSLSPEKAGDMVKKRLTEILLNNNNIEKE